jgi:hypothetical protein
MDTNSQLETILCQKCNELKTIHKYPCTICQRDMYYHYCNKCEEIKNNVIDVCSPKCRQILNGEAHIIPIQFNHQTFIIIEEFDDYLGLKVTDHVILNKVLSYEQKEKMKQKCEECKETEKGLLPYKCWSCKEVYTYEVECTECYNPNGYLCDECDYQING